MFSNKVLTNDCKAEISKRMLTVSALTVSDVTYFNDQNPIAVKNLDTLLSTLTTHKFFVFKTFCFFWIDFNYGFWLLEHYNKSKKCERKFEFFRELWRWFDIVILQKVKVKRIQFIWYSKMQIQILPFCQLR